jgi:hypothetical protein
MEAWKKAAVDLGIEVVCPYTLSLENGTLVEADVLVKNFGNLHGMLLSTSDIFTASSNQIVQAGFGYSVLNSGHENFDRKYYIEMLMDWSWSGTNDKCPSWFKDNL